MELGVCYYPEHWPEEMWSDDAARMAALGLSWVRIGEFAWSRIEPTEGQFDWDWLDRAVAVLAKAGLKIVMGTPSATPPRWVLDKYPDMLAVDAEGRPRKFGSRRHYCFSHRGYRAEAPRIARAMATRYGANPSLRAWQIDNEYGCHDTSLSFSDAARAGFRDWLAQKYQSCDALNRAWGGVFWSMEYRDFDEIDLPNLTVTEAAPNHWMDFRRYTSDQVKAFNDAQLVELRAHVQGDICHNYMGRITDFDHFDVGEGLDFASWDSYPLGFLEDRVGADDAWIARFSRQGDPDFQAFHHDLYRSIGKGRWWVMEQQPGPVNWAPHNPTPLDGMVKFWTLEAAAHGAEVVSYFRWRQAPFAQEQMHSGLNRVDNEPAPAYGEVAEARQALDQIGVLRADAAAVAIVFDYPSQWAWEVQPQGADFDYFALVFDFYRALRKLGVNVDFIPKSFAGPQHYQLVLAPGLFHLSAADQSRLDGLGDVVVYGPRTGSKTDNFEIPPNLKPLHDCDLKIARVETLRTSDRRQLADNEGQVIRWIEELETQERADLRCEDGSVVSVSCGHRHYLGAWLDDAGFANYLSRLCTAAGVETQNLPEGVRMRDAGDIRFWFNHNAEPVEFDGRRFDAASVIWEQRT